MMNSPNLTTVPLPPTNGRSIGDDSRRPASRGMLREPGHRIKTGENSRPTNGEYSTPAHTPEGKKELVGPIDGVRESAQSWKDLLLDLKRRGLAVAPKLAVADGALGFWQAIEEVAPTSRGQRAWVHKTANVLNKLPKSQQSKAKRALQEIWMAET